MIRSLVVCFYVCVCVRVWPTLVFVYVSACVSGCGARWCVVYERVSVSLCVCQSAVGVNVWESLVCV